MANLISSLVIVITVLVSVAFLTLFERKLLGYIQIRKGPNKVGFMGQLQPFADAVKLFSKEQNNPLLANYLVFLISPIFSLFIAVFLWVVLPSVFNLWNMEMGILLFLCITSLSVYSILVSGWSSNSKYPLLGALRGIAQTISYEVSLALIILSFMVISQSFDWVKAGVYQEHCWFIFIMPPLALMWFTSSLAETNRTPFDFAEGESELVSGFNTEYSSGGFALIMLAEYTSIIFMSMLFAHIFLGGVDSSWYPLKMAFIIYMFVWVRGTLPRFRYDKLMSLAWKSFLPVSINFLIFSSMMV
uniref:NADH-ubiquinone oxidoreductase chain 1 n=1 Tax=Leptestheria brevirostris TaxID=2653809 RepID=A0A7M1ICP0_9CRUS|nr:NADH dehydrogenase subunit 1 [Leptestheria brevirostris]QOQ37316.1 NADH dehydrogenase subunit 1 [Leptestheria brevirostris]